MANRTVYTVLGGTLAERPTEAETGRVYYDFETSLFYRYDGAAWADQPPPVGHPPHYTAAQIDAYIDGINSLAKAREFLKRLVRYIMVKV